MPETLRIEDGVAWVCDRRMPEAAGITGFDRILAHPEFQAIDQVREILRSARGFSLPYENGWTVSVSWGRGPGADPTDPFQEEVEAATVTITDRDGRVVVWSDDGSPAGKSLDHPGPRANVPARTILKIVDDVATWPTDHLDIVDRV